MHFSALLSEHTLRVYGQQLCEAVLGAAVLWAKR